MNLPRSGRPSKIEKEHVDNSSRTISRALQASLASVKVSVHDSTIRKTLGKNVIHGRVPRQKQLLTKKNTKACLIFAKKHPDDPEDFLENILLMDETRVELSGRCASCYIWCKSNRAFHKRNIIPLVKHGDSSVMI